jgi:hypothetical protein
MFAHFIRSLHLWNDSFRIQYRIYFTNTYITVELNLRIRFEPVEVELAADLGVRAARVGHVVAVEGHHVRQHVRGVIVI